MKYDMIAPQRSFDERSQLIGVGVNPAIVLLITGFVYILFLGGMALLRREGLSGTVALQALALTLLVSGFTYLTGYAIHPVLLLILLYLFTMRGRLLADIGNYFAQRRRYAWAERSYRLGLSLFPDPASRLVLMINQGAYLLQTGELDGAIQVLTEVLHHKGEGHLGTKYEAATHYNLGVAYLQKGMDTQAVVEFNEVIETMPASEFARRAENALTRKRHH